MLKRQTRQRREYLYRKQLELANAQTNKNKIRLKQALADGKQLPSDLIRDAHSLEKELQFDTNNDSTQIDDEYQRAGEMDPKILITTARDPSSRLTQFSKEMKLMFPNSQRMNRGNYVISDIVDACRKNDATDLIIFHEHRGQPGKQSFLNSLQTVWLYATFHMDQRPTFHFQMLFSGTISLIAAQFRSNFHT